MISCLTPLCLSHETSCRSKQERMLQVLVFSHVTSLFEEYPSPLSFISILLDGHLLECKGYSCTQSQIHDPISMKCFLHRITLNQAELTIWSSLWFPNPFSLDSVIFDYIYVFVFLALEFRLVEGFTCCLLCLHSMVPCI